jgi:hypothetical protein
MAGWARRIGDEELQQDADQILLEAARAGADLDGLRVIAQAAYEARRSQHPDDDLPAKASRTGSSSSTPPWTGPGA